MSLSSLLGIARSALFVYQRAMDVTAHNVANAQTPGFTRQRLRIAAETPLRTPSGTFPRGVSDQGVERIRDRLLDAGYRRESGLLGQASSRRSMLEQIEAALGEPSDTGLAATLDSMFQSFSDLANEPSSGLRRNLVQQAAGRFVRQVHDLGARIAEFAGDTGIALRNDVARVNELADRIADLNGRILASGGDQNAADLEDARDLAVDELSQFVAVRVVQHDDGTLAVIAGDTTLVDDGGATHLAVRGIGNGAFGVGVSGGGLIDPQAGSLAALTRLSATTLPDLRSQLDQFVRSIVTEVNGLHQTGYTLAGATGTDFFDPAGVTALTISLAPDVEASGDAIAAAGTNAPGDGAIALQIAQLANSGVPTLGGRSFRDFYIQLAATTGGETEDAVHEETVAAALVDQLDGRRASVSGVSVDEEMIALIDQQQAYSAAARIVQVAQDMMDAVLQMV